jgi:hypothetical protein
MKILLAAVFAALPMLSAAEAPFKELPLPEVKAVLQVPEGWTSSHEAEDGVFVYHFVKGDASSGTSITLSVTTKVPDRTSQSPAAYAASLIEMSLEGSSDAPIEKGDVKGLKSIRAEYDFESDAGKMRAVNVALANEASGTLYFFAWQAPLDESAELEAIRDKIVSSAVFDPAF